MNSGILCISLDTELLWGRKDLNWKNFVDQANKTREVIKKLLAMFKKHQVPVTWAIVGKLFEEGPKDGWHGKDIVEMIRKTPLQEIGSHSYSHDVFDQIDRSTAKKEAQNPHHFESFVFPRNKIKYLEVLQENGFTNFRSPDQSEYELLLPRIPPVVSTSNKKGLVEIPGSMYLVSGRGVRKYIPRGLRYWKCRLGIDSAIRNNKIFHIWAHPIDIASDTDKILKDLEQTLIYAKDKKGLKIMTMGQIAKSLGAS